MHKGVKPNPEMKSCDKEAKRRTLKCQSGINVKQKLRGKNIDYKILGGNSPGETQWRNNSSFLRMLKSRKTKKLAVWREKYEHLKIKQLKL